jgi:hypothetical protein
MTLRELRTAYRVLFHPTQDWFEREAFMDRPAPPIRWPFDVAPFLAPHDALVPAVALAQRYVEHPAAECWHRYLWTADVDHEGQRIYLGVNGRGLEIHRHLTLTARWGTPR